MMDQETFDSALRSALTPEETPSLVEAVMNRLPRWLVAARRLQHPVAMWRGMVPIGAMALIAMLSVKQMNAVSISYEIILTRHQLHRIFLALESYRHESGRYPERLGALSEASRDHRFSKRTRIYLAALSSKDGWRREWGYRVSRDGRMYRLYSFGGNGQDDQGADDDILVGL